MPVFQTPPTYSVGRLFNETDGNLYVHDNIAALFAGAGVVPAGLIVHWGLDLSLIPGGWALCDGASGTPDLRDRLIVGAGNVYALDQRGGRNSVTLEIHPPHAITPPDTHGPHTDGVAYTSHILQGAGPGAAFPGGVPNYDPGHSPAASDGHQPHAGGGTDFSEHQPISLLPPFTALGSVQRLSNPYSYTPPRIWVDGETPTAGMLNTELRDNPGYLLARILFQGTILPWSGSVATIPPGWALCNGQNGTVDMRDRFVAGAGASYAALSTGGSLTATIPAHSGHFVANPVNHGDHVVAIAPHVSTGFNYGSGGSFSEPVVPSHGGMVVDSHGVHTGLNLSQHGAHLPIGTVPPFYALCFIQLVGGSAPTTPKTWVDGEIIEAAELNTFLRDNELAIFAGQFPVGGIAMWRSGSPPTGFAFCDGLSGTPELRDRFIVGATLTYGVGLTGGALSAFLAGHDDHTVTNPSAHPTHLVVQDALPHGLSAVIGIAFPSGSGIGWLTHTHAGGTLGSSQHGHTGTGANSHSPHGTIDTTPPFHALHYVQRVA